MAKLEELTSILVSEIEQFDRAVKKLEEIREEKISIDITDLKSVLSAYEAESKLRL